MIADLRRIFDQKNLFGACAILLLGLGRASAVWWLSPFCAVAGLFCALKTCQQLPFWCCWVLFGVITLIQSSWLLSHPYSYIWGVWLVFSFLLAAPYALLAKLTIEEKRKTALSAAGWAAAFALLEWGFTFLPCGYSFQSAALQLSGTLWPLQMTSLIGAIGLGFFVFWTNILLFYAAYNPSLAAAAVSAALLPYVAGGCLFVSRAEEQRLFDEKVPPPSIAFCHMNEPPDIEGRALSPWDLHEQEWNKIFSMVASLHPGDASLLVLPEGSAPFAADSPLFRRQNLPKGFLPHRTTESCLSSVDLARLIASRLHTPVLIGLEGRTIGEGGTTAAYNSCFCITQGAVQRYDKQLLVPFGEYIPLSAFASVLSSYGIHDSFSAGTRPLLFSIGDLRISPLICYEETFSSYALSASRLHPNLLVSLTNDCWFPAVRKEHFELARLRAVEIGVPLIRSCNQGTSAAVDSLGRIVAMREKENVCVATPLSQYCAPSLYASMGETPIVLLLAFLWLLRFAPRTKKVEEETLR